MSYVHQCHLEIGRGGATSLEQTFKLAHRHVNTRTVGIVLSLIASVTVLASYVTTIAFFVYRRIVVRFQAAAAFVISCSVSFAIDAFAFRGTVRIAKALLSIDIEVVVGRTPLNHTTNEQHDNTTCRRASLLPKSSPRRGPLLQKANWPTATLILRRKRSECCRKVHSSSCFVAFDPTSFDVRHSDRRLTVLSFEQSALAFYPFAVFNRSSSDKKTCI